MLLRLSRLFAIAAALACALSTARAEPKRFTVEFMTLEILRDKGIITNAEFESAMHDLADSVGVNAKDSLTLVLGKWSTTMYGFVETDAIWDSTESFNESAGNALVARPTGYSGNNGRFMLAVRNSRLGFRLRAPEFHHVRVSAMLEMDFLGNQPPIGYSSAAGAFQISESAYFTNPAFRMRHYNLKIETPVVDILMGQYWQLFGWQSAYHPNTVEIQGLPGQIYGRTPQIRLSKTIKTDWITFESAIAMMRPPQRDSWTPEGQVGVRMALNKWTSRQTVGATGSQSSPLSFAVTGDLRQFNLPEFAAKPKSTVGKTGWGVAVDAFVPLLSDRIANGRLGSLAANFEYAYGYGIADLYTGAPGGTSNPPLPNPMNVMPAPAYNVDADPTLVVFDVNGEAHLINWESMEVGLQWYVPGLKDRLWLSGNFSRSVSNNATKHAAAGTPARGELLWADVNLFGDVTPSVRLGLEYAYWNDAQNDVTGKLGTPMGSSAQESVTANNHRVQFSAWYLF